MSFFVRTQQARAGDRGGEIYELTNEAGSVRAEVWPQWGFNCLKWQVRQDDNRWADILFHMPDWETNPVPTRSGHPILFPFPGRLRDGRITLDGKTYQLPLNDSTKQHAIHGFTPRNPWRVVDHSANGDCASVTGEFCLSKDLPESLSLWPSDFVFRVTYSLFPHKLCVSALVQNAGVGPLPFGLGYHGYFRLPGMNDPGIADLELQANVNQIWDAVENLPTGERKPVPAELDYRKAKPLAATALDNVFTGVTANAVRDGDLIEVAQLSHSRAFGRLRVLADSAFRELVLFTPQHRHAVAIEPYTCAADASNLLVRGIDTGWRVLPVGGSWSGVVEYRWEPREL